MTAGGGASEAMPPLPLLPEACAQNLWRMPSDTATCDAFDDAAPDDGIYAIFASDVPERMEASRSFWPPIRMPPCWACPKATGCA